MEVQIPAVEPSSAVARRRLCAGGCDRPENVCLCDKLPADPISTVTQIVILQHPHEQRHKLATVPILKKCLQNCEVVVGRKLRVGSSALLDTLYNQAQSGQHRRAIFLFPGTDSMPSMDINEWRSSSLDSHFDGCVLIAIDGTWKHAKEMVSASLPFLSKFATCVCFNCDFEVSGGSIYDSELILRKEPFRGGMSTMEAVARALRVVEPGGLEIEDRLIDVLRTMVRLQASYLKPTKPRPKLLKKGLRRKNTFEAEENQVQSQT